MRIMQRWVARLLGGIACLFTGNFVFVACYGMPPVEYDPQVELVDFSYTPASPIRVGESLRFEGRTNLPTNAAYMDVTIGTDPPQFIALYDDGVSPDKIAGDGVWTGERQLAGHSAGQAGIEVRLKMGWLDGHPPSVIHAPPLVLSSGEEVEQE